MFTFSAGKRIKLIASTIRRKRNSSGLSKVGPFLDDWAYLAQEDLLGQK
jgi:hypothetical protein